MNDLKKSVEAVLFAAARTVSLEELMKLIGTHDESAVKKAVKELKQELEDKESPTMIVEEGTGWKLVVHEKFLSTVQQIVPHTDLSRPILETLAVVAWKQPAKQADVVKYRGSTAYDHIKELERLGYIAREKQGRSFKVKVTTKFFEYFDLPKEKLKELFKDVKDVEEAAQRTLNALKEVKPESAGASPEKTLALAKKILAEEGHEDHPELNEYGEVKPKFEEKKKSDGRKLNHELEEELEKEN